MSCSSDSCSSDRSSRSKCSSRSSSSKCCSSEKTCCVTEESYNICADTTCTQICDVAPVTPPSCKDYIMAVKQGSCSPCSDSSRSSHCPEPCHPCYPCDNSYRAPSAIEGDLAGFNSVISPVNLLTPHYSPSNSGYVQFRMRRKNKTVTLQWEPFSGAVSLGGRNWIEVNQRLTNLPPYPMTFPLLIDYKGLPRVTMVTINPADQYHVRFYLSISDPVEVNDSFSIPASSVTWILD